MVEAPRIRIYYEKIKYIKGHKIKDIFGTSYQKYNTDLHNFIIKNIWFAGKYLYIHLVNSLKATVSYFIRTHFMMYGRIVINDDTIKTPFMTIILDNNSCIKWYMTQITLLDLNCNKVLKTNYCNESTSTKIITDSLKLRLYDISNPRYDAYLHYKNVKKGLKKYAGANMIITDFLLDQKYFPGVGNILQQEALYSCKINPKLCIDDVTNETIVCLIDSLFEICDRLYHNYRLNLKYGTGLKIYHKAFCPLNHKTVTKYIGNRNRRVTWCNSCQQLFNIK